MRTNYSNNFDDQHSQKVLRITYKQKFMGEVLTDTYIRTLNYGESEQSVINALYEDPHVIDVFVQDITGSGS